VAKSPKKGLPLEVQRGRPITGALSTYPKKLRDQIYRIRDKQEGWGAISILVELEFKYEYHKSVLPSEDAIS